ncbi:MAG: hypothetical protein SXU28_11120 [Pseudomonadota bacterium]|nr:hypothetical protein [Pseudomonadota bacterium]
MAFLVFGFFWSRDQKGKEITAGHVPHDLRPPETVEVDVYDSIGSGLYQIDEDHMRAFAQVHLGKMQVRPERGALDQKE